MHADRDAFRSIAARDPANAVDYFAPTWKFTAPVWKCLVNQLPASVATSSSAPGSSVSRAPEPVDGRNLTREQLDMSNLNCAVGPAAAPLFFCRLQA